MYLRPLKQIIDNSRAIKAMALTNNTTGASIYELGNIIKAEFYCRSN
jgi:alkyl hydroperoxide reductase subunit AhpC